MKSNGPLDRNLKHPHDEEPPDMDVTFFYGIEDATGSLVTIGTSRIHFEKTSILSDGDHFVVFECPAAMTVEDLWKSDDKEQYIAERKPAEAVLENNVQRLLVVAEIETVNEEGARQLFDAFRESLTGTVWGGDISLYQPTAEELRFEGFTLPSSENEKPYFDHEKVTLSTGP